MDQKNQVFIDRELEPLMTSYVKGRLEEIKLLEQSHKNRDFEKVKMIGHKLAGSAGSYGLGKLGDIGAAIEKAGFQKDELQTLNLIKEYKDYIERLEITFR